jgi:cytochrome c
MPRMQAVGPWWRILATGVALSFASQAALAQSPAERRGVRFARLHCAPCHAVDKVGESPLAVAPTFRSLNLRYPVADLQRPLSEGVHPTMPKFQLTAAQVSDLMAYLKSLTP